MVMSVLTAQGGPVGRKTAVVVGASIGYGLFYGVATVVGTAYLYFMLALGVPINDIGVMAMKSVSYLVTMHSLGFLCCIAGGAWTARLSEPSQTRNPIIAATLMGVQTLLTCTVAFGGPTPVWSLVLSLLIPFAGFHVGAVLHAQRRSNA